jgi:hypothetical protein
MCCEGYNLYVLPVFQDLLLFNGAFCWDISGMMVPLVRLIPHRWTSYLLYLMTLPLHVGDIEVGQQSHKGRHFFYHSEVLHYVSQIAQERKVCLPQTTFHLLLVT